MENGSGNCYPEAMNAIRKLPIGVQSFEILRTEGYLYVDKTDLMYKLVTEGYFGGKKDLFKGLAIEKLETKWKKYPVFLSGFLTHRRFVRRRGSPLLRLDG